MAMRTITIERGYDPREFTLVPFGGMGPTIAGRFIGDLGIGRILIPRDPGTFSAFGMLVTDVHQTRSFTRITRLDAAKPAELEQIFAGMEQAALADLMQEQFAREQLTTLRSAGMRYRGQSYEVGVPVSGLSTDADLAALTKRFHEAHRRRYGHMAESEAVEIVNFQVTAVGAIPKPRFSSVATPGEGKPPTPHETRTAYFSPTVATQVPVFRRSALAAGMIVDGPAVIEEKTSTTVLYPDQRATIDGHLNIAIMPAS
jgi:N-methylhydantoinase A